MSSTIDVAREAAREDCASFLTLLSQRFARRMCALSALLVIALAPYDAVIIAQVPGFGWTLVIERLIVLALAVSYLLIPARVELAVGTPRVVAAYIVAITFVFGLAAGTLTRWSSYWLLSLYATPFFSAVLFILIRRRAVLNALLVLAPLGGFALTAPSVQNQTFLVHTLGLWFATFAGSTFGGDVLYRSLVEGYALRRMIEAQTVELSEHRDTLQRTVNERTAEIRRLASRLDSALEDERRRMARELHDELGQQLTGMRLELAVIERLVGSHVASAKLERVASLLGGVHDSLRRILLSLRPTILDDQGLSAAVSWLARTATTQSLAVRVSADIDDELSDTVSMAAFRIVQEALTNVQKHANATDVAIVLRSNGDVLLLQVDDNGVGFDPRPVDGLGLLGMRERSTALGGSVDVSRRARGGTSVVATLPIRLATLASANETIADTQSHDGGTA